MKFAKEEALQFLDNMFQKNAGTLHNHSEVEAITTLKGIIDEGKEKVPCDPVSLQDIMALMLNKMIPKYRVSTLDSKGRNLMTYYKLQEQFEQLQPEIKSRLRGLCLQAVRKVRESPHY